MGSAFTFGDNVDTDLIAPTVSDENITLAELCMSGVDPSFAEEFEAEDVVVAGHNFGCGSSRETAPRSLLENGAEAVIASSFARIFYRNSINIGLPVYEISDSLEKFSDGDEVVVNHDDGIVRNETTGISYSAPSHPPFLERIMESGGLIAYGNELLQDE